MSTPDDRFCATYAAEQRLAARHGARMAALSALTLVPLFAALDAVVFPEHLPLFFVGRMLTIAISVTVLVLLHTRLGSRRPLLLGALVPVAVGLDVDAMTAIAGREANPYYAGIILLLLGGSLLLPWSGWVALAVSGVLVGGYVVGIVVGGPIANFPLFMTNTLLLVSATFLVVVGAAMSERLRWREFTSRRDLDEHARRQSAVAELGQLGMSSADSQVLFERAVAVVAETLAVDYCAVLARQPGEATLRLQAKVGFDPEGIGCAPADPEAGAPRQYRVAIGGRDHSFGTVEVGGRGPAPLTREEVDFVETVAGVLASAIAREQAEVALTEEMRTSTALARVGRELISSLETPVLLDRLCQLTADVLGADYSTTWLWHPDEQIYCPVSSFGLPADQWEVLKLVRLPLETVAPLLARLQTKEVYLRPASVDFPIVAKLVERHGATLAACFAFCRGDDILGVQVAGFYRRDESFTPQEQRLTRGIAQLAWMALTNARLVEALEQASRLKSEFVSTMSHELRTPLNVIVGYTDMLADDPDPARHPTFLAQIRKSSLELLEMIEATLDVSRIAAGKDTPRFENVRLHELWQELQTEYAALPRANGVTLSWECPETAEVYTDRRKLKIIVKNLVGNGLKFTPRGEVVVRCMRRDDLWMLSVRDTGVGVPETHLGSIFEIFRQVDSSDARPFGGVGLGLYIVRSLLAQLGGAIHVVSKPGVGSTFTATLPARLTSGSAARATG